MRRLPSRNDRLNQLAPVAFLFIFWLIFFWPHLIGNASILFRDTSYLYFPLFEWMQNGLGETWSVPAWNPYDDFGRPLIADGSSAVFYPPRLILCLPAGSTEFRFTLFVTGHVLFASYSSYWAARRLGTSRGGATMAALAFAWGGQQLFQVANLPFLISAAWLPLALVGGWKIVTAGEIRHAIGTAIACAMMILGGDPQMVYHVLLILLATIVCCPAPRSTDADSPATVTRPQVSRARRFGLFVALILVTSGLSAVQLIPSVEYSKQSARRAFVLPNSVFQINEYLNRESTLGLPGVKRGFLAQPLADTHHDHIYQFSLQPLRLVEMVIPNASGVAYPINRRWLVDHSGWWTPTIYFGLLPLSVFFLIPPCDRSQLICRWLLLIFVVFLMGSLGIFGVGWLLQATGVSHGVGEQVGGVYWLFSSLLPGYSMFRYPAKLFTIANLALVLAAAIKFDSVAMANWRRIQFWMAVLAVNLLVVIAAIGIGGRRFADWIALQPADDIWGPLNPVLTIIELRFATISAVICAAAIFAVWKFWHSGRLTNNRAKAVLIAILAVDLLLANQWMFASATRQPDRPAESRWESMTVEPGRSFRFYLDGIVPGNWREESDANRVDQLADWQRRTLFPKTNLADRRAIVGSFGSIEPLDLQLFQTLVEQLSREQRQVLLRPFAALMNLDTIIWPGDELIHSTDWAARDELYPEWVNYGATFDTQRAWIVRDVVGMKLPRSNDPSVVFDRTRQVLMDGDMPRDFRHRAVIETDNEQLLEQAGNLTAVGKVDGRTDRAEVTAYGDSRIELSIDMSAPGLVVISEYFSPGWLAEISTDGGNSWQRTDLLRTNRVMRGVILDQGHFQLRMTYRPVGIQVGAAISALAWSVLGMVLLIALIRNRAAIGSWL